MVKIIPLKELKQREADVACGKCFACCVSDLIFLDPSVDDMSRYQWHHEFGSPVLDRKPDGECIYLDGGCTIHENRPQACRRFDCRVWYLSTPKTKRKALIKGNASLRAVFVKGERLAGTLDRRAT